MRGGSIGGWGSLASQRIAKGLYVESWQKLKETTAQDYSFRFLFKFPRPAHGSKV
jgi:hypothetical protein